MPPKPSPTHFLCIPLATPACRPQLAERLSAFAADITRPSTTAAVAGGIPLSAVRPVGTLHLTLGMFSFPPEKGKKKKGNAEKEGQEKEAAAAVVEGSNEDVGEGGEAASPPPPPPPPPVVASPPGLEKAVKVLRSLKPRKILAHLLQPSPSPPDTNPIIPPHPHPHSITLRGLKSMQKPARKTRVLYIAPSDASGRGDVDDPNTETLLQRLCHALRQPFLDAELITPEDRDRPLLLHATVLNTVYVKGRDRRKVSVAPATDSMKMDDGTTKTDDGTTQTSDAPKKQKKRKRPPQLTIDAEAILETYKDTVWLAEGPLEKLAICKMGAQKTGEEVVEGSGMEDEAYEVVAEIDM